MKRLFLLLALILSISRLSFAQEVTLRIHTIAATGQDSPVRVVQLMLWPNPPDSYSPAVIGVMVHNFSDKKVVSARVEYWLRAPSGCAAQSASFSGGGAEAPNLCISSQAQKLVSGPSLLIRTSQ